MGRTGSTQSDVCMDELNAGPCGANEADEADEPSEPGGPGPTPVLSPSPHPEVTPAVAFVLLRDSFGIRDGRDGIPSLVIDAAAVCLS